MTTSRLNSGLHALQTNWTAIAILQLVNKAVLVVARHLLNLIKLYIYISMLFYINVQMFNILEYIMENLDL